MEARYYNNIRGCQKRRAGKTVSICDVHNFYIIHIQNVKNPEIKWHEVGSKYNDRVWLTR